MKISQSAFERELDALINAAYSASGKETARKYLIQAENKIDGYSDIPDNLKKEYRRKVMDARDKLDV